VATEMQPNNFLKMKSVMKVKVSSKWQIQTSCGCYR